MTRAVELRLDCIVKKMRQFFAVGIFCLSSARQVMVLVELNK